MSGNKRRADFDFLVGEDPETCANIINDVEGDEELEEELRALGYNDDTYTTNHTIKISSSNGLAKIDEVLPSFVEKIGEIDEDNIEITEDDMNDPDLISQFHELSADSRHVDGGETDVVSIASSFLHDDGVCSKVSEVSSAIVTLESQLEKSVNYNSICDPSPNSPHDPHEITSALEAKREALRFKKLGDTGEAVKWLRIAKRLEGSGTSGNPDEETLPGPTPISRNQKPRLNAQQLSTQKVLLIDQSRSEAAIRQHQCAVAEVSDKFAPLELALKDAIENAFKEAKRLKLTNPQAAAQRMRDYKLYEQELGVLISRKNVRNAEPAVYHYESTVNQRVVENLDISDQQIVLLVDGVFDLAGALQGQSSRSIIVKYDLGIPKDEPLTGTVDAKIDAKGVAVIDCRFAHDCIKRSGKAFQNLVSRKKASFEVILNRGFFFSKLSLGIAVLPLADLLKKCECGGLLPLLKPDEKRTSAGSGAGGSIKVALRLRRPLEAPEVITSKERKLVIDFWPPVKQPPREANKDDDNDDDNAGTNESSAFNKYEQRAPINSSSSISAIPVAVTAPISAAILHPPLSAREIDDPLSVDFIVSNDVLEAELQSCQAVLESAGISSAADVAHIAPSGGSEDHMDKMFTTWLRVQLIQNKIQILIKKVQDGELSMDQYLEEVKTRLLRDEALVAYYHRQEASPADVAPQQIDLIEKRIAIMRSEINTAEDAAAVEGADG